MKKTTHRQHESTRRRIQLVRAIVERHYEPGNQARCYKAVWRSRVYPATGICYRTMLDYIGRPSLRPRGRQLRLWEDEGMIEKGGRP